MCITNGILPSKITLQLCLSSTVSGWYCVDVIRFPALQTTWSIHKSVPVERQLFDVFTLLAHSCSFLKSVLRIQMSLVLHDYFCSKRSACFAILRMASLLKTIPSVRYHRTCVSNKMSLSIGNRRSLIVTCFSTELHLLPRYLLLAFYSQLRTS